MGSNFKGFSPDLMDFIVDLSKNNNREWFAENRERYDKFYLEPSKQFVEACYEAFSFAGLPYIADPKKSLFRIYRDIRFSPNKDPYKSHLGVYLRYAPMYTKYHDDSIGAYFHIDPNNCFLCCGVYAAESKVMKKIKARISEDWEELNQILDKKEVKDNFDKLIDENMLKRGPAGVSLDHPAIELLKYKHYCLIKDISPSDAYSNNLVDMMVEKAVAATPMVEYMFEAIDYDG